MSDTPFLPPSADPLEPGASPAAPHGDPSDGSDGPLPSSSPRPLGWIVLVVLALLVAWSAVVRQGEEKKAHQAEEDLAACVRNLTELSSAIDSYSDERPCSGGGRRYPESLKQIPTSLLARIPTCPVAGRDTYSQGYTATRPCSGDKDSSPALTRRSSPDAYTIVCTGSHAAGDLEPGFPQYSSREGLRTFPVIIRD